MPNNLVSPRDRLLRLRMKLQVFLQQKEPYEVIDLDWNNYSHNRLLIMRKLMDI